jgi:hypothetical protein
MRMPHYYYFTERLPHMNLTRVGTSVCDERQPPQLTASLVWKRTQRGLLWVAK